MVNAAIAYMESNIGQIFMSLSFFECDLVAGSKVEEPALCNQPACCTLPVSSSQTSLGNILVCIWAEMKGLIGHDPAAYMVIYASANAVTTAILIW